MKHVLFDHELTLRPASSSTIGTRVPDLLPDLVGAQGSGQRREVIGRAVRKLGFHELWYARLNLERTGPTPTRICIAYGDSRWHAAYVDRKLHEFDARLQPALRSSLPHRWEIGAMGQADATGSHLAGINELQAALRADGLRWGVMFCVAGPADKE
jgi:hypothetical protein